MAHSVVLSWQASTDVVDGYNIYRGTAAGAETTLVNTSGPVSALTFTDSNPIETAFYVVRAVKGGVESVNSNEITVSLPVAPASGLVGTAH